MNNSNQNTGPAWAPEADLTSAEGEHVGPLAFADMQKTWIGGCVMNRSPNELHGDACDCYKIQFIACAFGKVHVVSMCREWVRYMAERVQLHETHSRERTSVVVKQYVLDALGATDDWFRWHYVPRPRSKAGREVAGSYERLPTHFIEVVMDNRYGRIEQMVPCHIAAQWTERWGYDGKHASLWTGWTKGYRDVTSVNDQRYKQFMRALERACGRKEACKLTGLTNRKILVAMTELLTIKTKDNDSNKQ